MSDDTDPSGGGPGYGEHRLRGEAAPPQYDDPTPRYAEWHPERPSPEHPGSPSLEGGVPTRRARADHEYARAPRPRPDPVPLDTGDGPFPWHLWHDDGWGAEPLPGADDEGLRRPAPLLGGLVIAAGLLSLTTCGLAWLWWAGGDQPISWMLALGGWGLAGLMLLGAGGSVLRGADGRASALLAAVLGAVMLALTGADILGARDAGLVLDQQLSGVWSLQLVAGLAALVAGTMAAARRH